jgi:hypothetical protein
MNKTAQSSKDSVPCMCLLNECRRDKIPVGSRIVCLQESVHPDIIICDSCGGVIQVKDGLVDRCCRIERGDFDLEDRSRDNIKADVWLCSKCYLEDESLCGFFNRIGRMVR